MEPPGSYDPDRGPDADEWLALDENERVAAVEARTGRRPYAVMLATVETQIARRDELPVAATLERLLRLGMSRREAVHAIATVLAEATYDVFYGEITGDPEASYFAELERLTPESWRTRFDDDHALPIF